MSQEMQMPELAGLDARLLQEALRRALSASMNSGKDPDAIREAIVAEARRGTRDMHGLVRAAARMPRAA